MKMDYWDNPEKYEKRNEELYTDKKNGMSSVELVKKYGITMQRVYEIMQRMERNKKNG